VRLLILTCSRYGTASRILPSLCDSPQLTVVRVVLAHGVSPNLHRQRWRRLRKILKIGPLGALNGIRLRKWYRGPTTDDIEQICRQRGIPFLETPYINCENTIRIFREADADLGLSLGNGYIGEKVFSIPRFGMVNLHNEILPAFQGASSIIWPIYENITETGFTIHQVNRKIDDGDILYQEVWPIDFRNTLRETVEANLVPARERTPAAMLKVCSEYEVLSRRAQKQSGGKTYTTPSFWQYLRMVRNHKRLRARQQTNARTCDREAD
jgi:methionyl-tRNA formyltransferase